MTPAAFLKAVQHAHSVVRGLELAFAPGVGACALDATTQGEWDQWDAKWRAFVADTSDVGVMDLFAVAGYQETLASYEQEIIGWQHLAAKICGAGGPILVPDRLPEGNDNTVRNLALGAAAGLLLVVLVRR